MAELSSQLLALKDIVEAAKTAIQNATDAKTLDNVRVEYLGKKALSLVMSKSWAISVQKNVL